MNQVSGFFDGVINFFSEAGRYLQQAQAQNIPLIKQYFVQPTTSTNPYDLNQYAKDVREQDPAYQAAELERMKQQQTTNLIICAGAGLLIGAIVFK